MFAVNDKCQKTCFWSRFSMKNDLFSLFSTQNYCMASENKYFIFTFIGLLLLLLLLLYKIYKHQDFSSFPTNFILKNKTYHRASAVARQKLSYNHFLIHTTRSMCQQARHGKLQKTNLVSRF